MPAHAVMLPSLVVKVRKNVSILEKLAANSEARM